MILSDWFLNAGERRDVACKVPCSLYSVLLENEWMDDPFYGMNEYGASELCRGGCAFYTDFQADESLLSHGNILLRFHGLDTLCTVYLNGVKLGKTDNMHRVWEFGLKGVLAAGQNRLEVRVDSPLEYIETMHKKRRLWSGGCGTEGIPHLRKALYMFGWDWGPKLPDMGIFRPVELLAWDGLLPENVKLRQIHENGRVRLEIALEARGSLEGAVSTAVLSCGGETVASREFSGDETELLIENPRLWWPNGYGEQHLYTLAVQVRRHGEPAGEINKTVGLRTLTVSTAPDKYGEEFCFVINGHKIFSMGANYIPEDNILPRLSPARTERLIRDCVSANFNTIRVWGGGLYQEDWFYDLCDRYGLIVWQDFMFACINVYLSAAFEENVKAEFADNLRRIRHHASIGLLCGNNEMEWGVDCWGIGENALIKADYLRLYEHVIADACGEYAPEIFYWPSSPSSGGGYDDPNSEDRGDCHYWDVWHGNQPYSEYRKHFFRFCSEFGFESFPCMKTIRAFAPEDQLNPFSQVMESHQKCSAGNARILSNAAANYLYASSLELLVYTSQLVQADAIRYGVEHMRRFRGRCMGAAYWQLNDCWPVASWSSIDSFGRWKALHYAVKRFYAPVLLSAHEEGCSVVLNVSNETLEAFEGAVRYEIRGADNGLVCEKTVPCAVGALSALDIVTEDFTVHIAGHETRRYLKYSLTGAAGRAVSSGTLLFTVPKRFAFLPPQIGVRVETSDGEVTVILTGGAYARSVEIDFADTDIVLSDNYFDLTGEPVAVTGKSALSARELEAQLQIRTVYDIR